MSNLKVNTINDASGGSNAVLYGVAAPANSMGFRNRIINGDMRIDQRNAGASVTLGSGSTAGNYLAYPVDRFQAQSYSLVTGNGAAFTAQQNAGAVTPPNGFSNYVGVTVTSTQATLQNSSIYRFIHRIEGFNVSDLGWGAAGAQAITLSFWARSSVTGTFTGCVTNAGGGLGSGGWRSYPFTFAISAANTWEQKTVTIAGDTTGTWPKNNNLGLELSFSFGASSNFAGTAGAWGAVEAYAATGGVNLMATSGATFYITGVQLEAGSVASPFERRDYGRELIMCQRYFNKSFFYVTTAGAPIQTFFPVEMRVTPSITGGGAGFAAGTTSAKSLICSQTVPADQTLSFSSEL
jgi:hypothetical protein